MTNPDNPTNDPLDAELDSSLRKMAKEMHPRPAFVAKLRGELEYEAAHPRRDFWSLLARARPWLAQAVLIAALAALVLVAGTLTGRLFAPDRGEFREIGANLTPSAAQPASDALPAGALARLGKGKIQSIDVAPDGRIMVGSTASLCVYNTGLTPDWCRWTDSPVHAALFDPTGTRIAVRYSTKPDVEIWDAALGQAIASHGFLEPSSPFSGEPPLAAFWNIGMVWEPVQTGSESRLAVTENNRSLSLWNWQQDAIDWGPVTLSDVPLGMDWTAGPQGESILAVLVPDNVHLFDGQTGERSGGIEGLFSSPLGGLSAMSFSSSSSEMVLAMPSGIYRINLNGFNAVSTQSVQMGIDAGRIALSPDDALMAAHYGGEIITFDVHTMQETARLPAMPVTPMAWNPADGRLYYASPDGSLASFDGWLEGAIIVSGHTLAPQVIAWRDNGTVVTASGNFLYTWDISTQSLASIGEMTLTDQVFAEGISRDGTRALFFNPSSSDVVNAARLIVWDVVNNQPLHDIEVGGYVHAVTLSPDGTRLAAVHGRGQILTWKLLDNGSEERDVSGIRDFTSVDALAFHPSGEQIAVAYTQSDGTGILEIWSIASQTMVIRLAPAGSERFSSPISSLAWSEDAIFLGATQGQQVWVWDVTTMQPVPIVPQPDGNSVYALASLHFHPTDREILAAAHHQVHYLPRGELTSFSGHSLRVNDLAFRPDGEALASASNDGTVILWDLGAASLPPVEIRPTETPHQAPAPIITESTVIEDTPTSTPSPTPTQDINPPPGSPMPLPNATQRPIPDTTGYDVSQTSGISPSGKWTWMAIRGEWTANAQREEDLNFILVDSVDGPENWVLEEYTPHGLGEGRPTGFTFSADERYLFFYESGTPDGCGQPWQANLRRMDLQTGVIQPVPPIEHTQYGKFALSPDAYRLAVVTQTHVEIHSTFPLEPGQTSPFFKIPLPLQPPTDWSVGDIFWQPSGTSTLLALEIVSPPENACFTPSPEQQRWTVVVNSQAGIAWSYPSPAGYTLDRWKEGEHWSQQLDPPPDGELIYRSSDGNGEITVNPRTGEVVPGE